MGHENGMSDGGAHGAREGEAMRNSMQRSDAARGGPAAEPQAGRNVVRRSSRDRPEGVRPVAEPTPGDVTLRDVARTLLDGRWTIVAVAVAVLALTAAYLAVAPPSYESSVLIQVEGSTRPVTAFQDLAALFQEATPTEGEMRILRSRTLVDAVVAQLGLDIEARPRTFPFFGAAAARRHRGPEPAPTRFALGRYAWGGERLRVDRVEVSEDLVDEPLTLTALEGGRYRVAAADGTELVEAEVGKAGTGTADERSVELLVSELVARPGTEFTIVKHRRVDVVEALQQALRITEQGRNTGLVEVTLSGPDPVRVAAILDAVSATYLKQSVDRTSAEAAKTLRVLESQLPVLKASLEKAERSLNAFHRKNGTINLTLEGQGMLERMVEIDRAIGESEVQRDELARRFTPGHPEVPVIVEKIRRLEAQRTAMEARARALPDLELEETRLARQMRVATELYLLVLNRAEELRIVKSGWIGNVRVLERAAVPNHPSSPQPAIVLALALVLAVAAGVAVVLVRDAMRHGVKEAEEIETGLGLAVLASIPCTGAQHRLSRRSRRGKVPPLAVAEPWDPAVEDLRGLRTAVQYALRQSRNNVVGVSGLAPRAGKSFVSVNLAQLLAAAGGRVLLVDGDLRRGGLHRQLGAEGQPGLADVLSGKAELEAALRPSGISGLDLLPAGTLVPTPAELLAGDRLEHVLAELGRRYGVVIVDTPPMLSVADSALVGRHAGVNLLVLRAGEHSLREIWTTLNRLRQGGVVVGGAILNEVRPSLGRRRARRYGRYYAQTLH